jgi:hypothetical protein
MLDKQGYRRAYTCTRSHPVYTHTHTYAFTRAHTYREMCSIYCYSTAKNFFANAPQCYVTRIWPVLFLLFAQSTYIIQGGSNMTGTNCDLFTHKSSRSYLNHLVFQLCRSFMFRARSNGVKSSSF